MGASAWRLAIEVHIVSWSACADCWRGSCWQGHVVIVIASVGHCEAVTSGQPACCTSLKCGLLGQPVKTMCQPAYYCF